MIDENRSAQNIAQNREGFGIAQHDIERVRIPTAFDPILGRDHACAPTTRHLPREQGQSLPAHKKGSSKNR